MKDIFTLHAIEDLRPEPGKYFHNRTFGWFLKEKEAKNYLAKNPGWIHECLYDYVIIEQFPPGIHRLAKKEIWYKWNRKKQKYFSIAKPKAVSNIISWGMG